MFSVGSVAKPTKLDTPEECYFETGMCISPKATVAVADRSPVKTFLLDLFPPDVLNT
jgi:hypothetical protein